MTKYYNIKYFFLFLICVWEPLQVYIIKIDGAQRTIGVLILVTILLNINKPNFIARVAKYPIVFWGIWISYAIINTIQLGYNWEVPYYTFVIVMTIPLVVLWLIGEDNFNDRDILFNIIILGLFIRILLIFLLDTDRSYDTGRFGDKIDSNEIGISSIVLIVFLYLKFLNDGYKKKILFPLIVFPIYMIVISASRSAFGALSILLISLFIIHRTKDKLANFIILTFGILIILGTYSFLINNTYLGERLEETTLQGAGLDYDLSGSIFEKFGDRGVMYLQGWELFKDHPIRGIGLGNYKLYSSEQFILHSEFMVQLCELGLIGSFFFVLFYGWIGKNLIYCWNRDFGSHKTTEAYFVALVIILFMGLSIFQHHKPVFFLLTGAIISYILNLKEKIKKSQDE